jgi:hypothetical protein
MVHWLAVAMSAADATARPMPAMRAAMLTAFAHFEDDPDDDFSSSHMVADGDGPIRANQTHNTSSKERQRKKKMINSIFVDLRASCGLQLIYTCLSLTCKLDDSNEQVDDEEMVKCD